MHARMHAHLIISNAYKVLFSNQSSLPCTNKHACTCNAHTHIRTCNFFWISSKYLGLAASLKMVSLSWRLGLTTILPSPDCRDSRCSWYLGGRCRFTLLLWHTWSAVLPDQNKQTCKLCVYTYTYDAAELTGYLLPHGRRITLDFFQMLSKPPNRKVQTSKDNLPFSSHWSWSPVGVRGLSTCTLYSSTHSSWLGQETAQSTDYMWCLATSSTALSLTFPCLGNVKLTPAWSDHAHFSSGSKQPHHCASWNLDVPFPPPLPEKVHAHACMHARTHAHTHAKRERERERQRQTDRHTDRERDRDRGTERLC